MVNLTDEQYGALVGALKKIAVGYYVNPNGHTQQVRRHVMIEEAKGALMFCKLRWDNLKMPKKKKKGESKPSSLSEKLPPTP